MVLVVPPSKDELVTAVLNYIRRAQRRQTPTAVASAMRKALGASRPQIREAIAFLLKNQELLYSYEMGCSFLSPNTQRPWQASSRTWIIPPKCTLPKQPPPDAVQVRLQPGVAFGYDGHPTTKLCLQALDHLSGSEGQGGCFNGAAIDIGTGSGILALVAALFGCPSVLALDTDPCARQEAAANVALNRCQHLVRVSGASFEEIGDRFYLILANLRFPTLIQMLPWAAQHLHSDGRIIVSGYLRSEDPALETRFIKAGFTRCWSGVENRWGGSCFAWKGAEAAEF